MKSERIDSQEFPGISFSIEESDGTNGLPEGWLWVSIINQAGGVAHRQMMAPFIGEEGVDGQEEVQEEG